MYHDDFCGRNCELLSRRFLQKSQTYKHITHSSDNSIISVNYILSSIDFFYVPAMGQYTRGEGGQGRKPKLREEWRNERHKSSENAQEK